MWAKHKQNGFTVVELLIVVVVIVILATITVSGAGQARKSANDSERHGDINRVSKAIAEYRINNGHYPTTNDMASNTLAWIRTNLPDIRDDRLVAPGGTDANSFGSSTAPTANAYSYISYFKDDTGVEQVCSSANLTTYVSTVDRCKRADLRYRKEVNNTVILVKAPHGY